jgi:hypothetical protein
MTDTQTLTVIWPAAPCPQWAQMREIAEEIHGDEATFYLWQPDIALLDKMIVYAPGRSGRSDRDLIETLILAGVRGLPVALVNP